MIDKSQFPKIRCKDAFTSKGADAAIALGKELNVPESKMQRWLREWSVKHSGDNRDRGTYFRPPHPNEKESFRPMGSDTKSMLERRKKRVEIFPSKKGKGKPMIGYVLNAGPEQSEVYITDGPESLVDKVQCFVNTDLKEIKSKREL